jgi:hypothetical protein
MSLKAPRPSQTLAELEGPWPAPQLDDTGLVKTCHELRSKPIRAFSTEDLRIMVGQRIGLRFLVPIALDVLEQDPLAEGDFYPGDLLLAVLGIPSEFWQAEWQWHGRLESIVHALPRIPKELVGAVASFSEAGGPTRA